MKNINCKMQNVKVACRSVSPRRPGNRPQFALYIFHFSFFIFLFSLSGLLHPLPAAAEDAKSPRKAALLSLLLPGAGELYAGGGRSGRFFLFVEGASWTGLVAFNALESSRRATFESFAAAHSGVRPEGKSDTYFEDMVVYRSLYDRNARAVFLDGNLARLIPETPENIWEWDSDTSRQKFHTLRASAKSARQKRLLFIGAFVFNRFASAINAARIARKTQSSGQPPVEIGVAPRADGVVMAWVAF